MRSTYRNFLYYPNTVDPCGRECCDTRFVDFAESVHAAADIIGIADAVSDTGCTSDYWRSLVVGYLMLVKERR